MLCRNTLNAKNKQFLDSNFRRVLNAALFLLGEYPTSEFYMSKFRNTVPSSYKDGTVFRNVGA